MTSTPSKIITRSEIVSSINNVIIILTKLAAALGEGAAPASGVASGTCPVHHVPWQESKYGLAHPPATKGGKWCNKATLERSMAENREGY